MTLVEAEKLKEKKLTAAEKELVRIFGNDEKYRFSTFNGKISVHLKDEYRKK